MVVCDLEQDRVHVHGKEIGVGQGAGNIFVVIENVIEVDHGETSRHQIQDGMIEGSFKTEFVRKNEKYDRNLLYSIRYLISFIDVAEVVVHHRFDQEYEMVLTIVIIGHDLETDHRHPFGLDRDQGHWIVRK